MADTPPPIAQVTPRIGLSHDGSLVLVAKDDSMIQMTVDAWIDTWRSNRDLELNYELLRLELNTHDPQRWIKGHLQLLDKLGGGEEATCPAYAHAAAMLRKHLPTNL